MTDRLKAVLKEAGVEAPKFGKIEIDFRDGKPFDIIVTERIRIADRQGRIKERT